MHVNPKTTGIMIKMPYIRTTHIYEQEDSNS